MRLLKALGIVVLILLTYGIGRAGEKASEHVHETMAGMEEHQQGMESSGHMEDFPPRTRAGSLGLAEKYRDWAVQARKNAEHHREMAKSYAGGTKAQYRVKMREHCENIISLENQLAEEYDGLASSYEAEAKAME